MKLCLIPAADARIAEIVAIALDRARIEPGHVLPAGGSPWREAALVEGVDRMPLLEEGYTGSPRRTRDATRA